jgi:hypothetical protein
VRSLFTCGSILSGLAFIGVDLRFLPLWERIPIRDSSSVALLDCRLATVLASPLSGLGLVPIV